MDLMQMGASVTISVMSAVDRVKHWLYTYSTFDTQSRSSQRTAI